LWLDKKPYLSTDGQLLGKDILEGISLAMGLFLRDVHLVHFHEPGEEQTSRLPVYIAKSVLKFDDQEWILDACVEILGLIKNLTGTGR